MASKGCEICHQILIISYGMTGRIVSSLSDIKRIILTGQSVLDCTPYPIIFLVTVVQRSIATQPFYDTINGAALNCAQGIKRQLISDLNACDLQFSDAVCRPQISNSEG